MGAQFLYRRLPELPIGIVDFSSSGNNIVIPSSVAKRITVHGLWLVADSATVLTFKNGTISVSGPISLAAHQEIKLELRGEPWFTMNGETDFVINSSNATQVGGVLNYCLSPVVSSVASGDFLAEDGSVIIMEDGTRIAVES